MVVDEVVVWFYRKDFWLLNNLVLVWNIFWGVFGRYRMYGLKDRYYGDRFY